MPDQPARNSRVIQVPSQALSALARASKDLRAALEGQESYKTALRRAQSRELPDSQLDGSPIETLDQLAVAMDVSRKAVPFYVLETKDAPEELKRAAAVEVRRNKRKVRKHKFRRDPQSGAGNCRICARPRRHRIHMFGDNSAMMTNPPGTVFDAGSMTATKAASITAEQRRKYAKSGVAMPDGSFPIPDRDHLRSAIRLRGKHSSYSAEKVKAHIVKRARALGATDMLPEDWSSESKVQQVNGEVPTGVAVMAFVHPQDAQEIALPGGEAPRQLHVTLGYLKQPAAEYTDSQRQALIKKLAVPARLFPVTADSFATAQFNPDSDERDPCAVLLVQSKELADAHEAVAKVLGAMQSDTFPTWIPHIALKYEETDIPVEHASRKIRLDRLILGWGPDAYDCATGENIEEGNEATSG